jgi:hypothetical protein
MAEHDDGDRSESTQTRTSLNNIYISAAALSGAIYVGRTKKNQPGVWTDKRPAEAECFAAVIDHLQHGQSEPTPMGKTVSTDGGKTWWRVKVEPVTDPTDT